LTHNFPPHILYATKRKFLSIKFTKPEAIEKGRVDKEILMKRFIILLAALCVIPVTLSAQVGSFIKNGNVLNWKASSGHYGAMKVVDAYGQYFEIEQTNEMNRAAGVVKLYGAILQNGRKIVLINIGNWKEIWEGTVSGAGIDGMIAAGSAKYTFKITAGGAAVSTAPFIIGKTLKWSSNAMGGQHGTMYVSSINGSTFKLEQQNDKNVAAGVVTLDGEIKHGKIFIYNRQWKEKWVGNNVNGVVRGTINNRHTFHISE
jgi:outer membrane protein assembly factor BamB